ncbi:hypothetical protein D1BOALGB6SA_3101 [Olavius sp. associated proteobacterium Delta 1]|nr:hypothetical protein D1BOALGB6SA_3101 [Olavius sp. associated proteobacterium Delta 1]
MSYEDVQKQIEQCAEKGARFLLAFDENGDAMDAIAVGDCTEFASGNTQCVPIDFLARLRDERHESCIEIKTTTIIYAHSPEKKSCYIPMVTGGYICICCP